MAPVSPKFPPWLSWSLSTSTTSFALDGIDVAADFVGVGAGGVSSMVAGEALGLDARALCLEGLTAETFGL